MLDLLTFEHRATVQDILALTLCGAAIVWGGGPERIVAATWLLVFELAGRVQNWFFGDSVQLNDVDWFLASIDGVAGIVFIWVALYANRNYTLFIAGMQVLAMTAHLARGIVDLISPVAYAVMFIAPGWMQLFVLAIGLARHVQRKRKHGAYRDWRIKRPSISVGNVPAHQQGSAAWNQASPPSWRDDVK